VYGDSVLRSLMLMRLPLAAMMLLAGYL